MQCGLTTSAQLAFSAESILHCILNAQSWSQYAPCGGCQMEAGLLYKGLLDIFLLIRPTILIPPGCQGNRLERMNQPEYLLSLTTQQQVSVWSVYVSYIILCSSLK